MICGKFRGCVAGIFKRKQGWNCASCGGGAFSKVSLQWLWDQMAYDVVSKVRLGLTGWGFCVSAVCNRASQTWKFMLLARAFDADAPIANFTCGVVRNRLEVVGERVFGGRWAV